MKSMQRRLIFLFALLIGLGPSVDLFAAANTLTSVTTLADITGTGATVAICATCTNTVRWVQITTPSTNAQLVRWGDSSTAVGQGSLIAPGGGQKLPIAEGPYVLSQLYVYVANNDKVTITYGK